MVTETMANQQAVTGEASSSRRKRQRLPSTVEDVAAGANGGDEVITTVVSSGTLLDLDLLDCPVCCRALATLVFQCDNGHIACSSCCTKMRNKCPACTLPIGNYRCRIMERVVESVVVPCRKAKHGCAEKFSYGKELVHEKKCAFVLCYCPAPNCNYTGVYKNLYSHYYANHKDEWNCFTCGRTSGAWLSTSKKILVLRESPDGPLVAVQCFKEPQGMYVTVNCIAPSAPGVGTTMTFELAKMDRIQKVSFETPEKDFMLVPYYFLGERDLKMNICIRRLEEEQEEDDEEEEDDEKEEEEDDDDEEEE